MQRITFERNGRTVRYEIAQDLDEEQRARLADLASRAFDEAELKAVLFHGVEHPTNVMVMERWRQLYNGELAGDELAAMCQMYGVSGDERFLSEAERQGFQRDCLDWAVAEDARCNTMA